MDKNSASRYKEKFVQRVADARERAGYTQQEIADYLGISQGTYSKYEVRSFLPHIHIAPFCRRTGVSIEWLLGEPKKRRRRRPFPKQTAGRQRSA